MAVLSQAIGTEVLQALGLPSKRVTSLKLEMKPDCVVSVDVTYCPEREQIEECFEVIKRYELVEREKTGAERCQMKFANELNFGPFPTVPDWRENIDHMAYRAKRKIAEMVARARVRCDIDRDVAAAIREQINQQARYA